MLTSHRTPTPFEAVLPTVGRRRRSTTVLIMGIIASKATTAKGDIVGSCNALITPGHFRKLCGEWFVGV